MTTPIANPSNAAGADTYGDFAALERLKGSVNRNDPNALREVARQFESLFARMMIKSMRDAVGRDPIFGSDQAEMYQGMFDDQLSLNLTRGRGLGLQDMLLRQLRGAGAANPSGSSATPGRATGRTSSRPAVSSSPAASNATQASFIRQVWPQAEAAGQQLGVHPVSLVAQAALESNWGRSVPRSAAGQSSNNLFGIKAGSGWGGPKVTARTREFDGGATSATRAAFRSYASAGDSFQDYVSVLKSNPRFSAALNSGSNVQGFASALQRGGYATDPLYARKVAAVASQVAAALPGSGAADGSAALSDTTPLKFAGALPMTIGLRTPWRR